MTLADCQKCGKEHPSEDLSSDGLCIVCWDKAAGAHYFSRGAIAAQKHRDKIRYRKGKEQLNVG